MIFTIFIYLDYNEKSKPAANQMIEQPDDYSDRNSTNMSMRVLINLIGYYNSISEVFECFQEIKAKKNKQKQNSNHSTRHSDYNTASIKEASCSSKHVK